MYESTDGVTYALWQSNTTAKSAILTASLGLTYSFYSQATDADGFVEPAHTSADTQVTTTPLPWHNSTNSLNVIGGNAVLQGRDALLVIQYIHNFGDGPMAASAPVGSYFVDVLGNNIMQGLDALLIIQALNAQAGQSVEQAQSMFAADSSTNSETIRGSRQPSRPLRSACLAPSER